MIGHIALTYSLKIQIRTIIVVVVGKSLWCKLMSFERDCCFAKGAKSNNNAIVGAMICTFSPLLLCTFPNWNLVNDTKSQRQLEVDSILWVKNAGSKISSHFHLIAFTFDV